MRIADRTLRWTATAVAVATTVAALAGCGGGQTGHATATGPSGTIAFLLVRTSNIRYVAHDQPEFSERMLKLCPRCRVDVRYAEQDPKLQAQQVQQVLDEGAKVLVLNSADAANAGPLATMARNRHVPVIAYDRLVLGAPVDYYVSFDNYGAGVLQGKALLQAVQGKEGEVIWIDGPASDGNAGSFSAGAHSILDGKIKIAAKYQIPGPGWNADQAKAWMHQILPTLKGHNIIGVYSPIDPISAPVVSELKAAGISPLPAVTGQDCDVAGMQRVMSGTQLMSLYKPFHLEAEKSAELAYDLLRGKPQTASQTVDNKAGQIPSFLINPVTLTKDNIKDTVYKDGFVTKMALCSGQFADACKTIGVV